MVRRVERIDWMESTYQLDTEEYAEAERLMEVRS
jgi:hypothetical protein